MVSGSSFSYPSYVDCIGGENTVVVEVSSDPNMVVVTPAGSGDYPTIQTAIDCAPCEGDIVALLPGTYTGELNRDLDSHGRNLTVVGIAGRDETVIDCEGAGRGFWFHSGEDSTSVVTGLTVLSGVAAEHEPYGGGILCYESSPRFESIVVTSSFASEGGGGMAWVDCSPILEDVRFDGNAALVYGGGAFCLGAPLGRLRDVEFQGNVTQGAGGGLYSMQSSGSLFDVTFQGNNADGTGGGAYLGSCGSGIEGALFVGNWADRGAGMFVESSLELEVRGSTFAMNQPSPGQYAIETLDAAPDFTETIIAQTIDGAGLGCTGPSVPSITHCCSYGNASGDSLCGNHAENLFVDPLFCDVVSQDFTLHDDSPCLPAYNPWGVLIGKYGPGGCGYGTGVAELEPSAGPVQTLALHVPSPNPLSGGVALTYDLPDREDVLTVAVYNLRGEIVRTLYDGRASVGRGHVVWDGADHHGREVASGIYFVRAIFGPETASEKLVVVR